MHFCVMKCMWRTGTSMLFVAVTVSQIGRAGVTEVGVERPNNRHESQTQRRPGCWERKGSSGLLFKMLFFFFLFFYNCIVLIGLLPWEIRVSFPRESQLQQRHATQPMVHARCFSVSIIHQTLMWTTGYLTCAQVLIYVSAHGVDGGGGVSTP